MTDTFDALKTELTVMKERLVYGEKIDPVFEGTKSQFLEFDRQLQQVYKSVDTFMRSVEQLCEGLVQLSETMVHSCQNVDDPLTSSDSLRSKEACLQITRIDAPHSSLAKLRRDLDYNIINPLRLHLINNRQLKVSLENRNRKHLEYTSAFKKLKQMSRGDPPYLTLKATVESLKREFLELDKEIFEWLYILEEYKGDIMDSTLQTLKYLQYEFMASASHAIAAVLPARMEFRPLVEMTPSQLQIQVDLELDEDRERDNLGEAPSHAEEREERGPGMKRPGDDQSNLADYSARLIDKMQKEGGLHGKEAPDESRVPVDPLSLSSLLSQGFDEGPARKALRVCNNDTQAALEWLIENAQGKQDVKQNAQLVTRVGSDGEEEDVYVRLPTTLRRIQKLKEKKKRQAVSRDEWRTEDEKRKKTKVEANSFQEKAAESDMKNRRTRSGSEDEKRKLKKEKKEKKAKKKEKERQEEKARQSRDEVADLLCEEEQAPVVSSPPPPPHKATDLEDLLFNNEDCNGKSSTPPPPPAKEGAVGSEVDQDFLDLLMVNTASASAAQSGASVPPPSAEISMEAPPDRVIGGGGGGRRKVSLSSGYSSSESD